MLDCFNSGISHNRNEHVLNVNPTADDNNPKFILREMKLGNINRLVLGHININSLAGKFEDLKELIQQNIDVLVMTETKLDESFPIQQFVINGYTCPYHIDRNINGGGVLICPRGLDLQRMYNPSFCKQSRGNITGTEFKKNKVANLWGI